MAHLFCDSEMDSGEASLITLPYSRSIQEEPTKITETAQPLGDTGHSSSSSHITMFVGHYQCDLSSVDLSIHWQIQFLPRLYFNFCMKVLESDVTVPDPNINWRTLSKLHFTSLNPSKSAQSR